MAVIAASILISILGTITFFVTVVYMYFKYVIYNHWRKKNIVYEEPTVPWGNIGDVIMEKINAGELYMHSYLQFKKNRYFGTYALFTPHLVITDPDLIRLIMSKEFSHFHDRGLFSNGKIDILSANLFLMSGQKWKNLRIKLSPTFTSGKMKMLFGNVKACGDELLNYLNGKKGEDVDIKEILARFTTDVIMTTAFGVQSDCLRNPNSEFRYWGKKVFEPRPVMNALLTLAPQVLEILRMPYFGKDLTAFFTNIFQETFKHRLQEPNKSQRDFLDLLMQLINKGYVEDDDGQIPNIADNIDGKLTMLEGVAQAFVFFVAGFETSSTAATFCLYELSKNQEIQDILREEIQLGLRKHGGLTYNAIDDMPYLNKVVCETLRKYPPVMVLSRLCTKDIDLPTTDLHIEKGTNIIIPVLGLHRDPDIYSDPDKFDPERFNKENMATQHPYTYIPFGKGPRNCIGMRFGMMQVKISIICVMAACKFSLSPNTKEPLENDPGSLVYSTKNTIYLHLESA